MDDAKETQVEDTTLKPQKSIQQGKTTQSNNLYKLVKCKLTKGLK